MATDYTIGRLAKTVGLSRSTLLYYDRIGLLRPVNRSGGNYRLYSASEVDRLRRICTYRDMGLPLKQIGELIAENNRDDATTETMLERHLQSLEREIESLRKQQRQVVMLLEQITSRTSRGGSGNRKVRRPGAQSKGLKKPKAPKEDDMITKDRWVEIMRAAGLSDDDMHNFHRQFERLEPAGHQEFLESLGIASDEIQTIRERSKS
jgi:DNA-binding transcriptional MerR regulator